MTLTDPVPLASRHQTVAIAAQKLGAVPTDIPGLWRVPQRSDLGELTTNQLLGVAARQP